MKKPEHRINPLVILSLIFIVTVFAVRFSPVNATSMTLYTSNEFVKCLNANTQVTDLTAFSASGAPTNRLWAVYAALGLDGGDEIQYVANDFSLTDSVSGYTVAEQEAPMSDWVVVGPAVVRTTLSAYIGGYPSLLYSINNADGANQCFYVDYQAFYE